MSIAACLSTGKDDWETPDALFAEYAAQYNFILDAAANEVNHKCDLWFGPGGVEEDALTADWSPYLAMGDIWLNPPYSEAEHECASRRKCKKKICAERGFHNTAYRPGCDSFVEKAAAEALVSLSGRVVVLLPARTDTAMFHDHIYNRPNVQVTFLPGRLTFKGAPATAPFPSMIVVFS